MGMMLRVAIAVLFLSGPGFREKNKNPFRFPGRGGLIKISLELVDEVRRDKHFVLLAGRATNGTAE